MIIIIVEEIGWFATAIWSVELYERKYFHISNLIVEVKLDLFGISVFTTLFIFLFQLKQALLPKNASKFQNTDMRLILSKIEICLRLHAFHSHYFSKFSKRTILDSVDEWQKPVF